MLADEVVGALLVHQQVLEVPGRGGEYVDFLSGYSQLRSSSISRSFRCLVRGGRGEGGCMDAFSGYS